MIRNRGFSLVELSIVLVILGLLTGGILAGKSLIRAAELRGVTSEFQRYGVALQAFRGKYLALPGDMTNAQSFWGIDPNCPGDYLHPSTDARTCNGDGDGQIIYGGGGPEATRAWQHLANAGLVEGNYTGVTSDKDGYIYGIVGGIDVPTSRVGGEWNLQSMPTPIAISSMSGFDGTYNHTIQMDWFWSILTADQHHSLRPEEAWNIDAKMDDGKPATGNIRTYESNAEGTHCSDTAPSTTVSLNATAQYDLQNNNFVCGLVFVNAY